MRKEVKKDAEKVSFILKRGCSNFVYAEVETTLSLSCEGHVVPLRSNMNNGCKKYRDIMFDLCQTPKPTLTERVTLRAKR